MYSKSLTLLTHLHYLHFLWVTSSSTVGHMSYVTNMGHSTNYLCGWLGLDFLFTYFKCCNKFLLRANMFQMKTDLKTLLKYYKLIYKSSDWILYIFNPKQKTYVLKPTWEVLDADSPVSCSLSLAPQQQCIFGWLLLTALIFFILKSTSQ